MSNQWQFPIIKATPTIPDFLIAYRRRPPKREGIGATHFFLDDFRFESIWNDPTSSLKHLKTPVVLSPDFSLYRDWPLALQIWNTYRNRWCGAFWQSKGYQVIPTISWGGPESYEFCFAGLEPGGVVAISALGILGMAEHHLFMAGFDEMRERIKPTKILCYGAFPEPQNGHLCEDIITYPTFWSKKGK